MAANSSHSGPCRGPHPVPTGGSLAKEVGNVGESAENVQYTEMCESKNISGLRMDAQIWKTNGCPDKDPFPE